MKKIVNLALLVVGAVCLAAFCGWFIHGQIRADNTPPVLSAASEVLTISVWDDRDRLLDGVTALDEEDGDVTDSIVVEGVSAVNSEHCVTVTYAAFDRAGNVGKMERTVRYSDYEGPKFSFSTAFSFRRGITLNLYPYITATDPVDGDISDQVKVDLVSAETDLSEEGTHKVTIRVTNSMGDTARLTVPVEVYASAPHNATLLLNQYLVYLEKDSPFAAEEWVKSLRLSYRDIPAGQFEAEGVVLEAVSDVDTSVPGTYIVNYTASWDGSSGASHLVVVVEDSYESD